MSAAPRIPRGLGYAGLRMSADEYLALGETADRYELLDGIVFMSPSPWANHNEIAAKITHQILTYNDAAGGNAVRVFPETDIRLDSRRVYCPDISVYRADRVAGTAKRLASPPDLIVEILSESTKALDLITKRADYGAFGVREYWVVDPTTGAVRQWCHDEDSRELVERPVATSNLASFALPGFMLDLAPVRALAG